MGGAGWHRVLPVSGSLPLHFTSHCQCGRALIAYPGLSILIVFTLIRALGYGQHTCYQRGNPHPDNFACVPRSLQISHGSGSQERQDYGLPTHQHHHHGLAGLPGQLA